jgi:hypothetical protein
MDTTLRSAETCRFSAIFVALGLEPPVWVVCVPLEADALLLVVILLEVVVVCALLLVVILLEVVVV